MTTYVSQNKLQSGTDYFIDNIPGDGTSWIAITLSSNIRQIAINCRADNDDGIFTHFDNNVEFHFAKTDTPGDDWVHLTGLNLPIVKNSSEVVGYVQSAINTYVCILGLE